MTELEKAARAALEALERVAELTGAQWALEQSYAGHLEAITALRQALEKQPTTTDSNGGKTGWPPGLLQDDNSRLSKWFAGKPDARQKVREALEQQQTGVRQVIELYDSPEQRPIIQSEIKEDKTVQQPVVWAGLTDGEIYEMYNEPRSDAEMLEFAREVEAKLREKNGGKA